MEIIKNIGGVLKILNRVSRVLHQASDNYDILAKFEKPNPE